MVEYYRKAFPRVFLAAVDWAIGQGWLLTLVSAIGVVLAASFYAAYRAKRGNHSWRDAMNDIVQALRDFALSLVFGSVCALTILFGVFFVQDAPSQMDATRKELAETKEKYKLVVSPANLRVVDGGLRPVRNSNLYIAYANLFNEGQDAAAGLRLKLFYLNRTFIRLNTLKFNNANDIPGHGGYIITNDPQPLPLNEGAKYYVFAFVYQDKVTHKKYRKIYALKFYGYSFGSFAMKFEEPTLDEIKKLKEVLSDDLAPYEDETD